MFWKRRPEFFEMRLKNCPASPDKHMLSKLFYCRIVDFRKDIFALPND